MPIVHLTDWLFPRLWIGSIFEHYICIDRHELKIFADEVVRFGNHCRDPQWHYLDRIFDRWVFLDQTFVLTGNNFVAIHFRRSQNHIMGWVVQNWITGLNRDECACLFKFWNIISYCPWLCYVHPPRNDIIKPIRHTGVFAPVTCLFFKLARYPCRCFLHIQALY